MVALDRGHAGRVSRRAVVIVIPLGDADSKTVNAALRRHFPNEAVTWLDRAQLRRQPLAILLRLARERHDSAVLVAPDLRQSRLRLTSLVLALPRAHRRWRIDLLGNREA